MQILRTILWIAITAVLVAFVSMNWGRAPVNIWPLDDGYLFFEWPVGVIAILFFLLGLLPMWLLHRATKWRLHRRISSLESSLRSSGTSVPAPVPPVAHPAEPAAAGGPPPLPAELAPQPHPHDPPADPRSDPGKPA